MTMIIVQGTFRVDPETRDAYLAQSVEQMRISRAEKGCREYVIAADPLEADRVVLSERWESRADLDEHVRALTQRREEAADRGDDPSVAPVSREITVYEVASETPM
jgi:quinol monooxygenase YgiN